MEYYEVVIRLALAVAVGGIIGFEREYKNRPAGFRTHILVCVGAAVISMIQAHMVSDTLKIIAENPEMANALKADIGRIGAQVVTGVGFLGAGTIIHEKGSVKGLTTAASIWVVACIGLAVGMGYYFLSIVSTLGVYVVLVILLKLESRFFSKTNVIRLEIEYYNKNDVVNSISQYFDKGNIKIKNIEFTIEENEDTMFNTSLYTILAPKHFKTGKIVNDLSLYDEIVKVTVV